MARIPHCMCTGCNSIGTHKIEIAKRGDRNGFLCDFHFYNEHSYSFKNDNDRGVDKKNGFTFGIELETSATSAKARGELIDFGFIPTSDGSIRGSEFKSPIFKGLNAISKQAVSFTKLIDNGDMLIGNECGTHFHVGHVDKINAETIDYIRRFYHSLFIPLSEAMKADPAKTERMFGRYFTHYASPINAHSMPMDHCNFINVQHAHTIEFRLCKFINGDQYVNCAKFARDVVNAIIANFIDHFNDTEFDHSRYENITAYRKHKAQVTANKIVKLFEKYSA